MNITIDTENKEIILNEDINIEDFLGFIGKYISLIKGYTIKKGVRTIYPITYPLDGMPPSYPNIFYTTC